MESLLHEFGAGDKNICDLSVLHASRLHFGYCIAELPQTHTLYLICLKFPVTPYQTRI